MEWLDSIGSAIGGLFGGGSSGSDTWLTRNWDNIRNVANAGRQVYNLFDVNNQRQGVRSDLLGVYEQMAAQDAAYQQQMAAYNAQRSASAAAAARANAAAQRAAANKALKVQKKFLKQMSANYQPYADAAKSLTPEMSKNFKQYLDTTALLNQYLAPTVMQQMAAPVQPAFTIPVPKAAYASPRVEGQAVSFPTPEQIMGRK